MNEFWQGTPLESLSHDEWEALCDGCGRCCVNKLEDEDSGELYFTNVVCELFDTENGGCLDYVNRAQRVCGCLQLDPAQPQVFEDLPATCAYRLRAMGQSLPDWHPLQSGDPNSVQQAGMSVCGKVVSETWIHPAQLPEHVINWISPGTRK